MSKTSRDYTEFDALLLASIRAGTNTMAKLAIALASASRQFGNARISDDFRVVDRRLQALRKKKTIACKREGAFTVWSESNRAATVASS